MADGSLRTPGSGETIATDEVVDGTLGTVKVQYVKLMDGTLDGTTKSLIDTNGLKVATSNPSIAGTAGTPNSGVLSVQGITGATPVLVQGQQAAAQTGSIASASTTVGPFSASNYNIATVTVHGTYAGVNFGFWASDDGGTTWFAVQGVRTDSFFAEATSGVLTANTSRAWDIPIGAFTNFKVVSTAWTSGSASIGVTMQSMPYEPAPTVGLGSIAGTTPDVNTGAASAGTLRTVLATRHEAAATPVAVRPTVDGTNFAPAGTGADGATVPRITLSTRHETVSTPLYVRHTVDGSSAAAGGTGADGATVPRVTLSTRHEAASTPVAIRISADGTNFNAAGYPLTIQAIPGTAAANACSIFQPASGNIVAGVVKASAGSVYGFSIMNNVAAVTWIQFFNSTSTPTLGTSVVWAVPVPGGAGTGLLILMPGDFAIANFTTGIAWGAATAIGGSSAPATAPQGVCFYK